MPKKKESKSESKSGSESSGEGTGKSGSRKSRKPAQYDPAKSLSSVNRNLFILVEKLDLASDNVSIDKTRLTESLQREIPSPPGNNT